MNTSWIFLAVMIVAFAIMMWWSSRRNKKAMQRREEWSNNLRPGDPVQTASGLIGTIVSIDRARKEVVIESEGTESRWFLDKIAALPPEFYTTEMQDDLNRANAERKEEEESRDYDSDLSARREYELEQRRQKKHNTNEDMNQSYIDDGQKSMMAGQDMDENNPHSTQGISADQDD